MRQQPLLCQLPLSLGWLILVAVIRVGNDQGWARPIGPLVGVVVLGVIGMLLLGALRTAGVRRQEQTGATL